MGKRGPAKKPTAIKRLEGNPGKRALPDEPEISQNNVRPFTGTASEYWAHFEPLLKPCGVLTDVDVPLFKMLCENLAQRDAITAEMMTWANPDEDVTCPIATDLYERLSSRRIRLDAVIGKQLAQFGMTPAERANLGLLKPQEKESEFERLRKAKLKQA